MGQRRLEAPPAKRVIELRGPGRMISFHKAAQYEKS